MNRVFLALLFGSIALLLSGCWDRIEINDLALVTAAAIDKKEDQQIELTVQVFIPRALSSAGGMGGGGGGGGQVTTFLRSAVGVNMADAASKIQGTLAREIFWGHCKVYIFGKEMAEAGIREQIDFILRFPVTRGQANIYISKGVGADILESKPILERNSGEVLREITNVVNTMKVTVADVSQMISSEAKAAVIPIVNVMPASAGENATQKVPYIMGAAIMKEDKMVGHVSIRAARGIMWLRDEVKENVTSVKLKNTKGFISLMLTDTDVKVTPQIQNGKWKMMVKIKTAGDIVQNGTDLTMSDPNNVRDLEHALKEDIKNRIEMTLNQIQKEMKADVFNFATEYHRYYPREWSKVQDRWGEMFAQVEVKTEVDALIRRPGFFLAPAGLPEKEVKLK